MTDREMTDDYTPLDDAELSAIEDAGGVVAPRIALLLVRQLREALEEIEEWREERGIR